MKKNSIRTQYKENPVLLDKILQDIRKFLSNKLRWLNLAFGRAYKMVEYKPDGSKFTYPAAYNGNGEYISLLPNDNFGNFSWFDIYDPQKITETARSSPQYTFSGAMIFWYNSDSIYEDKSVLYTEEIKNEIIKALTTPGIITSMGHISVTGIYESFENVYKGYDYRGENKVNGV